MLLGSHTGIWRRSHEGSRMCAGHWGPQGAGGLRQARGPELTPASVTPSCVTCPCALISSSSHLVGLMWGLNRVMCPALTRVPNIHCSPIHCTPTVCRAFARGQKGQNCFLRPQAPEAGLGDLVLSLPATRVPGLHVRCLACSHLQAFSHAVPSTWNILPVGPGLTLSFLAGLFGGHFLREASWAALVNAWSPSPPSSGPHFPAQHLAGLHSSYGL